MVILLTIPGDQIDDIILAVGSLLTAIAAIVSPFFLMYKKSQSQHEDNKKVLTDQTDKLETVVSELSPNHGSSTKDAINRIEKSIDAQNQTLGFIKDNIEQLGHRLDAQRKDINELRDERKVRDQDGSEHS